MTQHDKKQNQEPEIKAKQKRRNRNTLIGLSLYALPWVLITMVNEASLDFFTLYWGCLLAVIIFLVFQRVRLANSLTILFVILFFSVIIIGQYVHYIKRVRTQDAVVHARMICNAMTDWISAPDMADGDPVKFPVPPVTTLGKGGLSFQEHFPSEGLWLAVVDQRSPGADPYYSLSVDTSNPESPVVMGTAWSGVVGNDINGWIVQAGGTGVESGMDLAGCKGNVEFSTGIYAARPILSAESRKERTKE